MRYIKRSLVAQVMTDEPGTWQEKALCSSTAVDSEWFFEDRSANFEHAKRVCRYCPVIDECLTAGREVPHGVWGGLSAREREKHFGIRYNETRPRGRHIDDYRESIIDMYKGGAGYRKVGDHLGLPYSMVKKVVDEAGITRAPDRSNRRSSQKYEEIKEAIAELYCTGVSIPQVVKALGTTDYMVKRAIHEYGISRPKDGMKKIEILQMLEDGEQPAYIATKVGTTVHYVHYIRRGALKEHPSG